MKHSFVPKQMTATSEPRWQPAGADSPLPCRQRQLCAGLPFPWLYPSTFSQGCSPSRTHRKGAVPREPGKPQRAASELRHHAGAAFPRGQAWGKARSPGRELSAANLAEPSGERLGTATRAGSRLGDRLDAEGSGVGGTRPAAEAQQSSPRQGLGQEDTYAHYAVGRRGEDEQRRH